MGNDRSIVASTNNRNMDCGSICQGAMLNIASRTYYADGEWKSRWHWCRMERGGKTCRCKPDDELPAVRPRRISSRVAHHCCNGMIAAQEVCLWNPESGRISCKDAASNGTPVEVKLECRRVDTAMRAKGETDFRLRTCGDRVGAKCNLGDAGGKISAKAEENSPRFNPVEFIHSKAPLFRRKSKEGRFD